MRLTRFGWLSLVAGVALGTGACGATDKTKRTLAQPGAGGETPATAGKGGNQATGGSGPSGGASAGTNVGGSVAGGDAGAPLGGDAGEGNEGGAGGDAPTSEHCAAPTTLSILGDYVEPNGDLLWLRDSGKAVTLTRVTAGKPSPAKLPSLWQVVRACPESSALVLKNAAGTYSRLDYFKGAASLTVCLATETTATPELAAALAPADRTNTIDSGCNDGPWTRVVKGGN